MIPPMKRRIQFAVSVLIAVVIVVYLFRDVDWQELFAHIKNASVSWVLLSQIPLWLSFATRIERWKYIVRSAHPGARWRGMFSATQIGFLANFVLPARAGEFIRPYALTRLEGVPFTKGLAMTTLDRVTDLFGLLMLLFITMIGFRPAADILIPPEVLRTSEPYPIPAALLQQGATLLVVGLSIVIIGLVVLYAHQNLFARVSDAVVGVVSKKLARHVHAMVLSFSEGLHIFRRRADMARSLAWSLVTWAMFLAATTCVINAFGIDYPWYGPLVVQAIVAIGIGVPVSPGFVGQYQVSVMLGLIIAVPGISYELALAVGLVTHALNLIPVVIAGVGCLMLENMSLVALRRDTEALREAEEEAEAAADPS